MRAAYGEISYQKGQIKRLTFSNTDTVMYPSIDNKGKRIVFRQETIQSPEKKISSIKLVNVDDLSTRLLFTDSKVKAPPPFEDQFLICGTKPPLISGNGKVVVFSLSLGDPLFMEDHYLGVINADGSNLKVIPLVNENIARHEWKKWGFIDETWRSISQYRISDDGKDVACLVKGHRGARDLAAPSGIVIVHLDGSKPDTVLAPALEKKGWVWKGFPRRPFTGGGWVFDMSGDGKKVFFGAQSSEKKEDYDLYLISSDGKGLRRIAQIKDRWMVRGDISTTAKTFSFFYSGKGLEGMGSYVIGFGKDPGLRLLHSKITDRIDFEEMSGDGKRIIHRVLGKGLALIEADSAEFMLLDDKLRDAYGLRGAVDFPYFPSFWNPRIMSLKGDRILLEAIPPGKDRREIYLLRLHRPEKEGLIYCPVGGRLMQPDWKYCPYDGTPLNRERRQK
jgi:hypothetical protein